MVRKIVMGAGWARPQVSALKLVPGSIFKGEKKEGRGGRQLDCYRDPKVAEMGLSGKTRAG